MNHTFHTRRSRIALGARPRWVDALGLSLAALVVVASAVVVKELSSRGAQSALTAVNLPEAQPEQTESADLMPSLTIEDPIAEPEATFKVLETEPQAPSLPGLADTNIRYFNGRPVRPARTIWMTVTAYSPDERSCAGSADGITASLHRVETNGFKLVAADSKVLPLGSMITVPGYDADRVVPVLDRGGAIKGNRLDILFPTHEQARKWGVKKLPIIVWEYADGQGRGDWRKIRDSK